MRPYQFRRLIAGPDVADIKADGRKTIVGKALYNHTDGVVERTWRTRNPRGDIRGYNKAAKKAKTRRYLKRQDKARARREWMQEVG